MNDRFNKWNKWIDVIYEEIGNLLIIRYIFREVRDIIKNNPKIQKPSSFHEFLGIGYTASAAMAVRRQVNIHKDSISFARLLKEICETPEILTRTRFVELYKGSTVEQFADEDFDEFAGKSGNHVNPDLVKSDLETLKVKAQKFEDFADKRIAHYDKRSPTVPTFLELDECIDFLEELMKKYYLLFCGKSSISILPVDQSEYDWKEIFREVWLPSGEEVNVIKQTLDAIYENGIFKPLKRPEISEGQQVRLTVEVPSEEEAEDLLELAAKVYQGLSDDQINEIEQIALNRRDFFGNRNS